jgi:hypothetical protein
MCSLDHNTENSKYKWNENKYEEGKKGVAKQDLSHNILKLPSPYMPEERK